MLVAPFFRASISMGPAERRLFERGLAPAAFEEVVGRSSEVLRQNLRRLFAAALLAQAAGGRLVFVEGWRSNTVGRRRVTGSWLFAAFLRLLRRRGLVAAGPRPLRREVSRCTWEEARALLEIAASSPDRPRIIGVSDAPCPSAARAARYLGGASVLTPGQALAEAHVSLSAEQRGFREAVQARKAEARRAPIVEAPNWVLHGVSEIVSVALALQPPLEVRLARALRRDPV
jgi:hypothetical protein